MTFNGFEKADFDLFLLDGFEERMEMLIAQLRPKFYQLGDELKGGLGEIVGNEIFPHVAKHARRKTNPPNDSWVAFATNKRGYKMMPHFQICVWESKLLIQWGIIYEAVNKGVFADNLLTHLEEIKQNIPNDYQWFKDHMKPEGTIQSEMSDEDFNAFAHRLKHNKNGEIMVGKVISREEALSLTPVAFKQLVFETWSHLHTLHRLAY